MSLRLGFMITVAHTCHWRVLQQSTEYAHIDVCTDFVTLADSARAHASCLLHTSHNDPTFCLSNLVACAALASSVLQPDVPVAEEDIYSCGDIVTGLSSSSTHRKLN